RRALADERHRHGRQAVYDQRRLSSRRTPARARLHLAAELGRGGDGDAGALRARRARRRHHGAAHSFWLRQRRRAHAPSGLAANPVVAEGSCGKLTAAAPAHSMDKGHRGSDKNVMQHPAATGGPPVWRDLDQKALDDAYDQDVYAPNRPLIVTRRIAASARTRAILGEPQRVAYGPSEHERLDIFRAAAAPAPVNVFIHGGAWRRNKGPDYHLQAEPLVCAGAHAVIVDFINVEQSGGDLFPMYEHVRRAIAWTWRNAESFGGDR